MLHSETVKFRWAEKEFEDRERSKTWYISAGIIAGILIIGSILFKNYLLAFIFFVGAFVIFFSKHRDGEVELSEYGIKIDGEKIPYEKIRSFWIGKNEIGKPILIMRMEKSFNPIEIVAIADHVDIIELREFLLNYVEEEEMEEDFASKIIRYFGL